MSDSKDLNMTFSGCGFLGIYHLGVVACMKDNAPAFLEKVKCFGGTSAGAFAATALLMDLNISESAEFVLRLAKRAKSLTLGPLHPHFRIVNTVKKSFQKILPENAHTIASGRLHISLTRVSDFKNIIVSEYSSKEDLIEALLATSHVPFYSSVLPAKFRGVYYVDGGITDNLPQHFEGETITVSPFSGESDICPRDGSPNLAYFDLRNTSVQFTLQNLYRCSRAFFPPEVDALCDMCKQGYRDTMRFLQTHYPETLMSDSQRKKSSSVFLPSYQLSDSIPSRQLSRSSSLSSTSVYSTCSNAEVDIFSEHEEQVEEEDEEEEEGAATDGESRLSMMLDITHKSISEQELWSCYLIRKAVWVFRMATKPCVLSVRQITNIAHTIIDYLPVIEKTGIEFMDQLLAMIYVMVHTYKNKHQVHHRKHGNVVLPRYHRPFTKTQATIQEVSYELVEKWRREMSHTTAIASHKRPTTPSPSVSSCESAPENSDAIEIIRDEGFDSSGSGGYDMCNSILFSRGVDASEEQLDLTIGQWESEGGACHPSSPLYRSRSNSDDYIILDGYETDIESNSSDPGDELMTSMEMSL